MAARLSLGGIVVDFDVRDFEKQIATFCGTNGITTQAQWENAVTNMTAAQQTAAVRAILRAITIRTGVP